MGLEAFCLYIFEDKDNFQAYTKSLRKSVKFLVISDASLMKVIFNAKTFLCKENLK